MWAKRAADVHEERAARANIPTTVTFQVTDRCNYDCVHCYQEHTASDELTFEEIDRILSELADMGVLFLTLMGGEFFMRPDADQILSRAHELGFAIKLLTTGHHVHEKRADFLKTVAPLQVDISVYSASHKIHDDVTTQAGSLKRSLEAAKRLLARGIPVTFKTPVMQNNAAESGELAALATEMGALSSLDPKVTGKENFDDSPTSLRMDLKTMKAFYKDESTGVPEALRKSYENYDPKTTVLRPSHHTPCRAGMATAAINPRGEVWPCNALPYSCGSLREQSFRDIWHSSPSIDKVRNLRWADISECRQCKLRPYCQRCHGMALVEQGTMEGPSLEACRHAVAVRDSLRDQGVISSDETDLPPTWDRVDPDGQHNRSKSRHLPVLQD